MIVTSGDVLGGGSTTTVQAPTTPLVTQTINPQVTPQTAKPAPRSIASPQPKGEPRPIFDLEGWINKMLGVNQDIGEEQRTTPQPASEASVNPATTELHPPAEASSSRPQPPNVTLQGQRRAYSPEVLRSRMAALLQ